MATVAEIKQELDAAGVEYPKGARKAELEELLEAIGDDGTVAPAGEPGIDPALVKARDDERAREAETRVGRVRPVPASIDPRLVEERKRTRDEDKRNRARKATQPPVR